MHVGDESSSTFFAELDSLLLESPEGGDSYSSDSFHDGVPCKEHCVGFLLCKEGPFHGLLVGDVGVAELDDLDSHGVHFLLKKSPQLIVHLIAWPLEALCVVVC